MAFEKFKAIFNNDFHDKFEILPNKRKQQMLLRKEGKKELLGSKMSILPKMKKLKNYEHTNKYFANF